MREWSDILRLDGLQHRRFLYGNECGDGVLVVIGSDPDDVTLFLSS
jgi:hypothetical protein